jgi:tRNA (uracil-5-)-methyltransferase TRM9
MNPTTLSHLLELNRQFYQSFALPFSGTRRRLQPGVNHMLNLIDPTDDLLDLGCGNGELARKLAQRGHAGTYTGVDYSSNLLEQAAEQQPAHFRFVQADLSNPDWEKALSGCDYDAVLMFAVLHHIPGQQLRLQILHKIRSLLPHDGHFIHSEWQFLSSPRLAGRVQPWETVGLDEKAVDPGDYLLDWRTGGTGLRYVHHFSEAELAEMASITGFEVVDTFLSDGKTHNLGLYQIWRVKETN